MHYWSGGRNRCLGTRRGPIPGASSDTYLVTGDDVDHQLTCVVTTTGAGASQTLSSAPAPIGHVATEISDASAHVQRGPTFRFRGQVAATGPVAAGTMLLVAEGIDRDVVVARASLDAQGDYELTHTVRALVPGRTTFRLEFVPLDPELHSSAQQTIALKTLSPVSYPFARVAADRRVVFADGVIPFWRDGSRCSVGCRPAGVLKGWPIKPFHEQHALRAGLNERRLSGSHVGIDIMTTFPQAIYAIQSGRARILHNGDSAARVRVGNYIYWHVNLRVREGEQVKAYHTILGYSFRWMRHLHLCRGGARRATLRVLRGTADRQRPARDSPRLLADHQGPDLPLPCDAGA